MSSKSNAMDPSEPFTSSRMAFFRPSATRLASKTPIGPPSNRALKTTASSTVTGPRSTPAPTAPLPPRPTKSPPTGRSLVKVSMMAETPVMLWPVTNWAASMLWAPMSPRAPEPDFDLSIRHVSGAFSSESQSCRYCARTWRMVPSLPSRTMFRASVRAGVRR